MENYIYVVSSTSRVIEDFTFGMYERVVLFTNDATCQGESQAHWWDYITNRLLKDSFYNTLIDRIRDDWFTVWIDGVSYKFSRHGEEVVIRTHEALRPVRRGKINGLLSEECDGCSSITRFNPTTASIEIYDIFTRTARKSVTTSI